MRAVSSATCTLVEPRSFSWSWYFVMMSSRSSVSATIGTSRGVKTDQEVADPSMLLVRKRRWINLQAVEANSLRAFSQPGQFVEHDPADHSCSALSGGSVLPGGGV